MYKGENGQYMLYIDLLQVDSNILTRVFQSQLYLQNRFGEMGFLIKIDR
jgi:hypothetical protein